MRYPISFNSSSKVILGLLGAGQSQSHVDVLPDKIEAKMGWMGKLTIDRDDIVAVETVERVPWWLGFGMHSIPGTLAMNGSWGGGVKVSTRTANPARGKMLGFTIRPHTIYFTLERPDEFAHELGFASQE
jgi:hypothetical protein